MPLPEDSVLENRYRIDKLLAYGGMSAVYRAYDTNLQVEVAIKENYFQTPEAVEQFKREALMLARLRHPGLPRVLQHFVHEGQQYLVMEFIAGPNLWEIVKQHGGPFDEAQALGWIDRVCDAVAYLHTQSPPVIHRDIKPQNIKVMPGGQVVLVDFGIAKEGDAGARTATGARGVTPGFSPPEQYSAGGSSPASDIYALGATLYALLTGVKPPDSVSLAIGEAEYVPPDKLNPSISPAVAEAITWAMQPKPGKRPQTVGAWREKLQTIPRSHEAAPAERGVKATALGKRATAPESVRDEKGPVCPTCGAQNRPGVRFCEGCGAPLASLAPARPVREASGPTCTACGAQNRPGVRFCKACGEPLISSASIPTGAMSPESTSACASCGAQNRPGLRFCEECGAPLASPAPARPVHRLSGPTCTACGAQNRPGVRFCEHCGAPLTATTTEG